MKDSLVDFDVRYRVDARYHVHHANAEVAIKSAQRVSLYTQASATNDLNAGIGTLRHSSSTRKHSIGTLGPARREIPREMSPSRSFSPASAPLNLDSQLNAAARAKIAAMSERIDNLEHALQAEFSTRQALENMGFRLNTVAQSGLMSYSNSVHPLLEAELLDIKDVQSFIPNGVQERKTNVEGSRSEGTTTNVDKAAGEMTTAFGTLSLSDKKNMRFFGASAAEVCRLPRT